MLLLDEPMNSLDVAQQSALDKILSALCQQGLAIVMSSHDLNHTLRHAHRAWLLKGGKMLASGRREEVLTPANLAPGLWDEFSPSGYRRSQNADFDHLISLVS